MSGSNVVVFDWNAWISQFPEFATMPNGLILSYFARAERQVGNFPASVIPVGPRTTILYLVTAHITKLNAPLNGAPASDAVGRVSQASQGSVSVSLDVGTTPGTAAWYYTTKYGFEAWNAMAQYHTARYFPSPRMAFGFGRRFV